MQLAAMRRRPRTSFRETLTDAVNEFVKNGYDSELRLRDWLKSLRDAAAADMVPESVAEDEIRRALGQVYRRLVEDGGLMRKNPGAGRFTLARVRPRLRAELDRRILAAVGLIKINRERAVQEVLQRFSGWATSIPVGGSDVVDRVEVKKGINKPLGARDYIGRRLRNDQSHKLVSSLSSIFAQDGGAIAGEWIQHYTRFPREAHTRRNGKVYLVRDSWAHQKGLVKPGPAGYTDEVTQPGEEVSCRCSYLWRFGLSQLPVEMLTQHGKDELARVRALMAA